jgi:Mrp family chromosome partitioning ATPase/capsular polysaccharide biosynthesis protein
MTLRDYLNIIRERVILILATVAAVTSLALVFSYRQVPQYSATARLRVQDVGAGSEVQQILKQLLNYQTSVMTEAEIVRSSDVAEFVISKLKLTVTPEELLDAVEVTPKLYTEVLEVTATWTDRATAKYIADGFARGYIEQRRHRAYDDATELAKKKLVELRRIQTQLTDLNGKLRTLPLGSPEWELLSQDRYRLTSQLAVLQEQYQALLDRAPLETGAGEIIEQASIPTGPSSPNHVRNGILGFLVSLPLAIGLTLLRDSLTDTVKTKEEAEHLTGAQTLALIPHDHDWHDADRPYIASLEEPSSLVAEAYRTLRVNLEFAKDGQRPRNVLVTSPGAREGKSTTAANLGVAFAEAGRRTVLVSADLRRPRLNEFMDVGREPGLSNLLRGQSRGNAWLSNVGPNLWFVPSGSPDGRPENLLSAVGLEALFDRLDGGVLRAVGTPRRSRRKAEEPGDEPPPRMRKTSDVVLLDMPPILRASEVAAVAPAVDGVLLVLHAGVTRRVAASRAAEQVRKVGGRVLGVVLVGTRPEQGYDPQGSSSAGLVNRTLDRVLETLRR